MVPQRPLFMGWRIDIEPDDLVQFGGELWIIGQLELAGLCGCRPCLRQMRCTALTLMPLAVAIAPAVQCVVLARWIGQRTGDDSLLYLSAQRRDARRAGLVAQQPGDTIRHVAFLPAPDRRLARLRAAHNLRRATTVRSEQDDLRPANVLLWAVPIGHDRRKLLAISGTQLDCDTRAHAAGSHWQGESSIGLDRQVLSTSF
jgi:hypothetical protein